MSSDKKYIINRSNYTLKKKHKILTDNSIIYERDYMVTNNGDTWSGDGSPYGTSSFKMVNNTKNGGSYKYNNGEWLKTSSCNDGVDDLSEVWTLGCIPDKIIDKPETKTMVNLPKTSLLNFVYYGSCKELIKNSIKDIILNFPAEISFTSNSKVSSSGKKLYKIENPFLIDLHTTFPIQSENNLRNFIQNFEKYKIINEKNEKIDIFKCIVTNISNKKCPNEWELLYKTDIYTNVGGSPYVTIFCYNVNNKKEYYTDTYKDIRIRPNDENVNYFFEKINCFQKNMLNRYTTPIYTMFLDFPHETEKGVETYKKRFTWPIIKNNWGSKIDDWNIDTYSSEYEKYVKNLLTLSDFYDERCTNNMWRSLVHDSIKNMDYTFKNDKIESDEYELGESKFEKIISCYSNQFDEIKQYADNIKNINNIVYDNDINIPNFILSNKLEMGGWEVYNISNILNENENVTSENIKNANTIFMKNLLVNSKYILSHKCTKHGIEMLLGLFGLKSYDNDKINYDYKIVEYVDTVIDNKFVSYEDILKYNALKNTFKTTFSDFEENNTDLLQGIPVKKVKSIDENYYLVPWFDKKENYDGDLYFQMFGGWGKTFNKEINKNTNINDDIKSSENVAIYDETIKYLINVNKIEDLKYILSDKLYDNCVAHVNNISNFNNIYVNDKTTTITLEGLNDNKKASNYFILKNIKNSYIIGCYDNNETTNYGWVNITQDEFETNTDNAIRVKLLENVIENHKGNNPHGGFGKYDDGESYTNNFKQLFKYSIENNNFKDIVYDCETGEIDNIIPSIGFNIERQIDNVKTWYFTDTLNENNIKLVELEKCEDIVEGDTLCNGVIYKNIKSLNYRYDKKEPKTVSVGKDNGFTFFESYITPYQFETNTGKYDESEANSLINNKKLLIEFSAGLMDESVFPLFLEGCILPYLKQMIPSTTIWEIRLEGDYAVYTNREFAEVIENKE